MCHIRFTCFSTCRWGYRLQNVIKYQKSRGYKVQFPKFHSVIPVPGCPTSSAQKLHEEKELSDSRRDSIRFSIGRSSGTDVRSTSSSSLENSNSDISNFWAKNLACDKKLSVVLFMLLLEFVNTVCMNKKKVTYK